MFARRKAHARAALCVTLLFAALALADCRTATREQARPEAARAPAAAPSSPEGLNAAIEKVRRLHTPMGPP